MTFNLQLKLCPADSVLRNTADTSYSVIQYSTILYCTVPYRTVPYRTVPYRTVPYRTVPYRTVPYRTVPYYQIISMCYNGSVIDDVNCNLCLKWVNNQSSLKYRQQKQMTNLTRPSQTLLLFPEMSNPPYLMLCLTLGGATVAMYNYMHIRYMNVYIRLRIIVINCLPRNCRGLWFNYNKFNYTKLSGSDNVFVFHSIVSFYIDTVSFLISAISKYDSYILWCRFMHTVYYNIKSN